MIKRFKEKIFGNSYKKVSYSQCGEDIIVDFILSSLNIKNITYLDIGAHYPIFLNNTYLFYKKKFKGICVEPDPETYEIIRKTRPKDICLNIGIGIEKDDFADFFIMSSRSLNTFSKETADMYVNEGGQKVEKIIKIPLCPVKEIIRKYLGISPNFISLDAEGLDLQITQNFDFIEYRPDVFCIETLSYSSKNEECKNLEINRIMEKNGYLNYADTYVNTIFVDKEKWIKRIQ